MERDQNMKMGYGSTQRSIDRIFRQMERCLIEDPIPNTKVNTRKISKIRSKSYPMERALKKTFAEHWIELQKLQERHMKNERSLNHLMRKQSKDIIKKWQSDLVKSKLAADKVKKETEKLKALLKKKPIIKGGMAEKASALHQHFKNSDGYLTKLHRRNVRQTYRGCVKTD